MLQVNLLRMDHLLDNMCPEKYNNLSVLNQHHTINHNQERAQSQHMFKHKDEFFFKLIFILS